MTINWTCKYCAQAYVFTSKHQIGGHLTNCKLNPKYEDIQAKAIQRLKETVCVPRIEFKQNCPTCNKEFIQILTEAKINNKNYNTYCDRICANSKNKEKSQILKEARLGIIHTLSHLSNDDKIIALRKAGLSILDISRLVEGSKKYISKLAKDIQIDLEHLNRFKSTGPLIVGKNNTLRKIERDTSFIKEADELFEKYKTDPLFMLGLGLYWGEGAKTHRTLSICNADPNLLKMWIRWHDKFAQGFKVSPMVYGHKDVNPEEAFAYWSKQLNLNLDLFKFVKCLPISSKEKRPKKILPYGTCSLRTMTGSAEMFIKMKRWLEKLI